VLHWRPYRQRSATWDHDHCEFCWADFALPTLLPDALHAGYATEDEYRWICERCFNDFRHRFAWHVATPKPQG